ncbi:MAG TPA: DsbA family protein [Hyphomicrobiales bacterium]|nr:DsbA family protein [Hyphomicrobiales bacterium]
MLKNPKIAVLASGLAFFAAFAIFNLVSHQAVSAEQEKSAAAGAVSSEPTAEQQLPDMTMGKADAPVTIIEYASLSCPHCAAFEKDVFPALKSEYIDTGKARYIMREFPHNEQGLAAAVVARCLDPSRYFAFIEMLFSKQNDWAFKDDALPPLKQLAKQAGMSEAEFDKCIDDEALQKKILAIRAQGEKMGVTGIPTLFVNGKIVKGAATLENLAAAMKPYLSTQ